MIAPNSKVRVNLAGLRVGTVTFSGAVTDALGTVIRQSMEDPPTYLVKLLFSFKAFPRSRSRKIASSPSDATESIRR